MNQMIEYQVALKFANMVGRCRICNIAILGWGDLPHADGIARPHRPVEQSPQCIDLPALAQHIRSRQINHVE